MSIVTPDYAKKRLRQIRANNIILINNRNHLVGEQLDKLQSGDYDYTTPQPQGETLGYFAQKLRDKLGVTDDL